MVETDKVFLKTLLEARDHRQLTSRIQEHFWAMTQDFLIPFERFITRILPLKREVSPFKVAPSLRKFDPKEFLELLPQLEAQSQRSRCRNWPALYVEPADGLHGIDI